MSHRTLTFGIFVLAEFIVSMALNQHKKIRSEWDAYDFTTKEGLKVELKNSLKIAFTSFLIDTALSSSEGLFSSVFFIFKVLITKKPLSTIIATIKIIIVVFLDDIILAMTSQT